MIKISYATWGAVIPMLILTCYFSEMMDEYHEEKTRLQKRVWELEDDCGFTEVNKIAFNVTVTTYNPTVRQCDDTPNITADGTRSLSLAYLISTALTANPAAVTNPIIFPKRFPILIES